MEFEQEESEGGGMSRMQELLSSYYGMQGEDESPQDVTNIDSSCFQPEMYVEVGSFERQAFKPTKYRVYCVPCR